MLDSRMDIKGIFNTTTSTYIFQIKDIKEDDAGVYRCRAIRSINEFYDADVELQINKPPFISDNSTLSVVVVEGKEAQLVCDVSGFPPPTITWHRENKVLPTNRSIYQWVIPNKYSVTIVKRVVVYYNIANLHRGNVLKITSIVKEDRGVYYCVADIGDGHVQTRNISVEVEYAPFIMASRPCFAQALQYDMDLKCHIEAYPPPVITWYKDGVRLAENQHYNISHCATGIGEYIDTTLRVITIEKQQYGEYFCKAVNDLGHAEAKVELIGKYRSV